MMNAIHKEDAHQNEDRDKSSCPMREFVRWLANQVVQRLRGQQEGHHESTAQQVDDDESKNESTT